MDEREPPQPEPDPIDPPGEPPGPPPPRRLTRSRDDRVLGGVAGGLGRYFSIDPIIFRIGFVVLSFVGGTGLLAYLAALLFVPDEGDTAPLAARRKIVAVAGVVVLAIAALSFLGSFSSGWWFWGPGPGVFFVAIVAMGGVLLWRAAQGEGPAAATALARGGLAIAIAFGALFAAAAVALAAAAGGGIAIAAIVIVLGLALIGAAFAGGARWLIAPALVLAIPLGLVVSANADVGGGIGDRHHRPGSMAELDRSYDLGVGELRVDLRDLTLPAGDTDLDFDVGVGHVIVLVPEDACVTSDVEVGMGYAEVLDRNEGGVDIDLDHDATAAPEVSRVRIKAEIGVGALEVERRPEDLETGDRRFRGEDDDPVDANPSVCRGVA
jgi:phage shock protein PspC (stress-responsive transcriptional regulator)